MSMWQNAYHLNYMCNIEPNNPTQSITQSSCPVYVFLQKPVEISQSLIVLSREALNKKSPPGENSTHDILCSCPISVLKQLYCLSSQIFIDKSYQTSLRQKYTDDADARYFPVESNATLFMLPEWPFRVRSKVPYS